MKLTFQEKHLTDFHPDRETATKGGSLTADEIAEISRALEPGQQVEITQGSFQGIEALVTRVITARKRVEILIEWMGRTLRADACVTDLKPLSEPRLAEASVAVA